MRPVLSLCGYSILLCFAASVNFYRGRGGGIALRGYVVALGVDYSMISIQSDWPALLGGRGGNLTLSRFG